MERHRVSVRSMDAGMGAELGLVLPWPGRGGMQTTLKLPPSTPRWGGRSCERERFALKFSPGSKRGAGSISQR